MKQCEKKVSYGFCYIFVTIICIFLTYNPFSKNVYFTLAVACVIETVFFMYYHKKISHTLLSFSSIYVLILNIFHFGQIYILGFFFDQIKSLKLRIVLNYFSVEDIMYSMRIINIAYVCICYGVLRAIEHHDFQCHEIKSCETNEININKKTALTIIFLSFPLKVYIDVVFFYKSFTIGFMSAINWLYTFPDFIKTIANISMVGFACLIILLKDRPKKQFAVLCFILVYLTISVISGRRSETIVYIVVILFVYIKNRKQRSLKKNHFLIWIMSAYFFLTFLYTTVRFRDLENKTISEFIKLLKRLLISQNVFMEAIREYGNTGYTPICVISNWLNNYPPSYGKSYIYGIFCIFPNVGGFIGTMLDSSDYAHLLQKNHMVMEGFKNIGGSVIGELFFNFGIFGGIVFSLILGLMIGKISAHINVCFRNKNIKYIYIHVPIMISTLYWIRDSFGGGIRETIWGICLFCFIRMYINKKCVRR